MPPPLCIGAGRSGSIRGARSPGNGGSITSGASGSGPCGGGGGGGSGDGAGVCSGIGMCSQAGSAPTRHRRRRRLAARRARCGRDMGSPLRGGWERGRLPANGVRSIAERPVTKRTAAARASCAARVREGIRTVRLAGAAPRSASAGAATLVQKVLGHGRRAPACGVDRLLQLFGGHTEVVQPLLQAGRVIGVDRAVGVAGRCGHGGWVAGPRWRQAGRLPRSARPVPAAFWRRELFLHQQPPPADARRPKTDLSWPEAGFGELGWPRVPSNFHLSRLHCGPFHQELV